METQVTVKIKIWGIVQGVGFRPFVAKLADRMGMKGEVRNIGGLVDIVVTDTRKQIDSFLQALTMEKPIPAEIVHRKMEQLAFRHFNEFTILDSDEGDDEAAMIPADLALCPHCLEELFDKDNPRYWHPFISCMVCGPRYTIIDKIPYDRQNTAMIDFPMCDFCEEEYTDRQDRRYHAQTISCHDCGPSLEYRLPEPDCKEALSVGIIGMGAISDKINKKAVLPIALATSLLMIKETVIGFKGVGGYNLICSPFYEKAVKDLRKLKGREEKPFAVMFKDVEQIKAYCHVSQEEENLLVSSARPIVLLERKPRAIDDKNKEVLPICEETYRGSRFIGAFLPSMGAQYLLLEHCGPLIVTSANLSDQPMMKDEKEMFDLLDKEPILAAVFYNQREIKLQVDDSVVRVIDGQPQMIRRAKGYAPVPLYINSGLGKEQMILATGGQLKSAFSLSKGPFAYVSQYFGDLDSYEVFQIYKKNVEHLKKLFRIKPKLIVCDMHPLYQTTSYAKQNEETEILYVQHHHAHVASVMAEHDLQGSVIGVAFDGTGYGTDGAIWGGEFFICKENQQKRVAHLEYVNMLGGDASMKDGWKSAMSYAYAFENRREESSGNQGSLQNKILPSDEESKSIDLNHQQSIESIRMDLSEIMGYSKIKENTNWKLVTAALQHNINKIQSSSMGRLFDAVAALLDINQVNRYEGECAIMLENAAAEALKSPGMNKKYDLALRFHYDVAEMILSQCLKLRERYKINQVALTGGVFQNKILMEKALALLRNANFEVYYNVSVGPNDGGICLGQNYIGMHHLSRNNNQRES